MTDPDCDLAPEPSAALAALYEVERPKLLRVAYVLTDSLPTAEEIVQDAFVKLQSTRTPVTNPGGCLRTSVVNACRDLHRHRAVVRRARLPPEHRAIDHPTSPRLTAKGTAIMTLDLDHRLREHYQQRTAEPEHFAVRTRAEPDEVVATLSDGTTATADLTFGDEFALGGAGIATPDGVTVTDARSE